MLFQCQSLSLCIPTPNKLPFYRLTYDLPVQIESRPLEPAEGLAEDKLSAVGAHWWRHKRGLGNLKNPLTQTPQFGGKSGEPEREKEGVAKGILSPHHKTKQNPKLHESALAKWRSEIPTTAWREGH